MKFWTRIITERPPILYELYEQLLTLRSKTWCSSIRDILERLGFGYIWQNQQITEPKSFLSQFLQRMKDCHMQDYNTITDNTSRLTFLSNLRINPNTISSYLKVKMDNQLMREISQFRLSSHNLIIETGRWHKPEPIPRDQRLCVSCDMSVIESEYHFLLICPRYENLRRVYIPQIYLSERSERDFVELLNSNSPIILRKLAIFLRKARFMKL